MTRLRGEPSDTAAPVLLIKREGEQIPTLREPGVAHSHSTTAWKPKLLPKLPRPSLGFSPTSLLFLLPSQPPCLPFTDWGKKRNVCGWAPRRALHISAMPGSLKRRGPRGLGSVARTGPRPSITQEGLLPPQDRVSTLGLACHSSFSGLISSLGSGSAKL